MSELSECYATLSTPFGELGPFYDAQGHRGADYERRSGEPIIAYDDMRVEYVGYSSGLGQVIGLRRLTLGGFAGFAHVIGAASVGVEIARGASLAAVADYDDPHGSLWSGPHIHTTESASSAVAAALGVRPLTDPAPTIAAAIGASIAGGAGIIIPEEEPIMALRQMHYYDGADAIRAAFSEDSGYFSAWRTKKDDGVIANSMAANWATGGSVEVTPSLYARIQADCAALRSGS